MNEDEMLHDTSTSAWLRDALRSALLCDPVTVANEAALLTRMLHARVARLADEAAPEYAAGT